MVCTKRILIAIGGDALSERADRLSGMARSHWQVNSLSVTTTRLTPMAASTVPKAYTYSR